MFGFSFLFATALWALPLAGLPLLLHLLFRRKSPVVPFSTLRFIKASIQHTAARRRVQRWLLLATRALLLALLIWAVAQPARILASRWFEPGKSLIAAVVIDTSYSMQLQDGQLTLLSRADGMVQDLLRNQLKDARIAIFRSQPSPPDDPERLRTAADIQSSWTPLTPQPSPVPLGDRVAAAVNLLKGQSDDQKWLLVITDLQSREFSHPMPDLPGGRVILLDLHPDEARSAGVTRVSVQPQQPLPGIRSDIAVELTGRAGDARAVALSVCSLDEKPLLTKPPLMANFDTSGRVQVRLSLDIPAQRFLLLKAAQQLDDPLTWAKQRTHLIETPPRQVAVVLDPPPGTPPAPSLPFIRLAMDPSEGSLPSWPIDLHRGGGITGNENVLVAALSKWPDVAQASRLLGFARSGGLIVLFLQPGLEESWSSLSSHQRSSLLALLPAAPSHMPDSTHLYHALAASATEPLLANIGTDKNQLNTLTVRRFVPFAFTPGADPNVVSAINLTADTNAVSTRQPPLLLRKKVGDGLVYTLATLPDSHYSNLATHPLFLPLLVNMCLRPIDLRTAQNVEIGNPLVFSNPIAASLPQVEIRGPQHDTYVLAANSQAPRFVFTQANQPGIYTWHKPGDSAILGVTNVQLPAAEAELIYRPADSILTPGPATIISRSLEDLGGKMALVSEPEPHWSGPIAVVLFLLCLEAWMGSVSKLWKPIKLGDLLSLKARTAV